MTAMTKEKILIIEDDENIVRSVETALGMVGYRSFSLGDGREACKALENAAREGDLPDLILLDIMLPGANGFSVMEKIARFDIPVIFLTALQDVNDKVKGLKLGAEDYIVKPFEALELLARIEVVLRRRTRNSRSERYRFRDLVVDPDKHSVLQGGKPVKLTPKEFDLFLFFLRNEDLAISRERLLSAIWGFEFEGESRTVDVHVQQLRKKLGLHDFLVTVPKLGYRLERPRDD